ncbi:UDP-N-acetylmuramate--L-alanine ligase [Paraburkholderia saeva]|uniref:UDP-N-acetylmuramate--L-alanine ligase n=1 Tax=Paraburkholderia saeva TaxID=2777537 RepID=A0A9N8RRX7_9BURK|nr:UDP-N-acetylmuramate--L-alanine ligase [Paraburkholderia saeva]CAG4885561.1 UDP-N-acetylmuramate--L-alanine ligase [Paraburkholderia saeva]CAG4887932.1 UDP-N-acetylmuramate--L-alanine ligase [Paraburkholderia saeva]CAG4916525.1 UDP-N-acetylmuramate--L-alanine ligase [Paraburkholderia saeva]
MKHIVKHIHFVGIGGAGMSGIAEVLVNLGYQVSGSDLSRNAVTDRLAALGARIAIGHDEANIEGANAVVVSTAVRSDNPEVLAARHRRIPIVPRAVMLAELMRLKQGIAIAGTHGKTTTTSLVASVLAAGGLDPTFVIGGRLISAGANARLGTGDFIVAEADESDASFLNLFPVIEVITNIDADHMDTYGHDFARLKQAFIEFTHRLPFYGIAVLCVDDPNVKEILPFVSKPIIRYGFAADAQVRAVNVEAKDGRMHFTAMREDAAPIDIVLNLPGTHNVQNALAAIAIATELEVKDADIQRALADFNGVGRRFQRYGEVPAADGGTYTLVDDYGHHPVEMAATVAAARGAFPDRRLVLAFQPHRYTRTRDCFEDFVKVLSTVDALVLTEVYAAGEAPIIAADGRALARALRVAGKVEPVFVDTVDEVPDALAAVVRGGDVVITMGAGSIGGVPGRIAQEQKV